MFLETVACGVVLAIVGLLLHLRRHFSQFTKIGIPGPHPNMFLGNLLELRAKGQFQAVKDWTEEYGRVFGYFEGYTPVMVVSDPEVLRHVLLKDAANFMKRKPFPLAPRKSLGLFLEDGPQWKRSRSLLTPAFSTGKLKKMTPIMTESADILVERLTDKAKEQKSMDIYSVFQSLTLDVIGRCAFGLQTKAQVDDNDLFLVKIRKLFHTMSTTLIEPLVMAVPFVSCFIFALKNIVFLFGMNPVVWLRDTMREVIRARLALGPNANVIDLVQLMLFPDKPHHDACADVHVGLTEREIVAQSMTFLLAGYETTSAILAYFCHEMAKNPAIQAKLYQEIVDNIEKDVNYESIQDLHYFDAVFDEVCRLYPTASFIVSRQACETRRYGHVTIPAGMNVLANVWALHRDKSYWTDPDTFNPERFMDEPQTKRSNFTFLPFGAGPRHCIGMRFATIEAKITIVKVMQSFCIERADDSQDELELFSRGAIVPKDKVNVKMTRRVTASRRRMVRHS
ncbi:cytochrome P450 3A6-like [Physella acuta]|uniref:cytochrome P450 3A6-like n=1 Tax=Physella acuta TaxID=109671 RepID=UPI0027DDAF3F|nr:cytochrome P450 3A6-like [Physella acuta]